MRGEKSQLKFYLLDSTNFPHLSISDHEKISQVFQEKIKEKVDLGLKTTSKFIVRMSIQSLFDARSIFTKLLYIFNRREGTEGPTMPKLFISGFIHNFLKYFHERKEQMFATLPAAIQDKAGKEKELLRMPKSAMFSNTDLYQFVKKQQKKIDDAAMARRIEMRKQRDIDAIA
jgi:hypothetical protein